MRLIRRDAEERIADSGTALKSMRKLIDLIEAGDGDGAAKHWRLHLINANKAWAFDGSLRDILAE